MKKFMNLSYFRTNFSSKIAYVLGLVFAPLIIGFLAVLYKTLRWHVHMSPQVLALLDKKQAFVLCFPHGRMIMNPAFFAYNSEAKARNLQLGVLVSQSRDGGLIGRIAKAFGITPVYGSILKGSVASSKEMSRMLSQGISIALPPDGPLGPRLVFTPGARRLALLNSCPLVFVSFSAQKAKVFRSAWDHFMLPYPFSRAAYVIQGPYWPEQNPMDEDDKDAAQAFEQQEIEKYTQVMRETVWLSDQMAHRPAEQLPSKEEIAFHSDRRKRAQRRYHRAKSQGQG